MFDFAWSEIAVIGVVALIAIGPKDMPRAIRTVTDVIKKGRRMASEFQGHVDEMVREANLHEVREHVNDLRSLNLRGQLTKLVDGDGTLRRTLAEDPFRAAAPLADPLPAPPPLATEPAIPAPAFIPPGTPAPLPPAPPRPPVPAFIPPEIAAFAAPARR